MEEGLRGGVIDEKYSVGLRVDGKSIFGKRIEVMCFALL